MLNPSDVYVQGGTTDLLACWTDKVTKYDASSFYNWEMDNLPLHDLDERTHLLWERAGHPTSAITGMSYMVSAEVTEGCNPTHFATLSSCMAALPDVINYPILVEVVSFGDLGTLEIPAKTFGPRGALEIVNRNSSFAAPIGLSGSPMSMQLLNNKHVGLDAPNYGLASGVRPCGEAQKEIEDNDVSGPSLSLDLMRSTTFINKGADGDGGYSVASSVGKPWSDERFHYDYNGRYVFTRRVYADGDNRMAAALNSTKAPWNSNTTDFKTVSSFEFDTFDGTFAKRTTNDPTMDTFDVSTFNYLTNTEMSWGNHFSGTDAGVVTQPKSQSAAAFAYCNNLRQIKIHDCNGPIFIRNFTVDCKHTLDKGIDIKNSSVVLERCSVSRANLAGLHVENSNVSLVRGFVAYRNYKLITHAGGSHRVGIPFAEKRVNYYTASSYGAGIYATNSTVNVSSTYARDVHRYSTAAARSAYPDYTGDTPCPSMQALYCLSRNDIGIHAVNSQIIGGRTELAGSSTPSWLDATQVFSELNTETGIKLENSKFENSGRVLLYGNYKGLEATNSTIRTDVLKCAHNQAEGIDLNKSTLVYGKDLYTNFTRSAPTSNQFGNDYRMDQVGLVNNGTHLKAVNSVVSPLDVVTSSIPTYYNQFFTSGAFGTTLAGSPGFSLKGVLPSMNISKNSDVELIHFVGNRRTDFATGNSDDRAVYGSVIRVDKNSSVVTRSSDTFATIIAGPKGRDNHILHAGVYCNDNSLVSFQGPTVIASLGVDVLADNNSKMEFTPHRNSDGELLVSSYNLDSVYNHTAVELHSTRACLVANNNSEINMQDLGDYKTNFANKWNGHGRPLTVLDKFDYLNNKDQISNDAEYRNCVSGGYVQFYPNAYVDNGDIFDTEGRDLGDGGGAGDKWVTLFDKNNFTKYGSLLTSGLYNWYIKQLTATDTPGVEGIAKVSSGGMCVRALKGSKVNVTNVHFPAGWQNTSGFLYNLSGSTPFCTQLRMWNIADDSVLNASYTSVSGVHPFDTIYHGTSGDWGVSSAPSCTPGTSSLSVLDFYGAGNNNTAGGGDATAKQNPYGFATFQNRGPFRLYFSTDPAANWLQATKYDTAGAGTPNDNPDPSTNGMARQLFSQGYQLSAPAIAHNTANFDASTEYRSLLRPGNPCLGDKPEHGTDGVHASGYYYANEMVVNPNTIKAYLDESASNLFANAKHNSVGWSNLAKVVNIYFPYTDYPLGGDSNPNETGAGKTQGLASVNNFDLEKNN